MDPFSFEDLLPRNGDESSPGSQLFLYRLLQIALSEGQTGLNSHPPSYRGVKELVRRLEIKDVNELTAFFDGLGLGRLDLDINENGLSAALTVDNARPGKSEMERRPTCELARGLIDGSLGQIMGIPVSTAEIECRHRGSRQCRFEAMLDLSGKTPRFVPGVRGGSEPQLGVEGPLRQTADAGSGTPSNGFADLRSWFMDIAVRELARARRHKRELTVMYLDLDDLGIINTTHGRHAGDLVIKTVGSALSRGCRSEDFLWHQGEDEFAMVLAETGAKGASIVAGRMSTLVFSAAEYIDVAATISASIGFSVYPAHGDDIPGLFSSARSAVYLAKSMGKGRFQIAGQSVAGGVESGGPAAGRKQQETRRDGSKGETAASDYAGAEGEDPVRAEPVASVLIASGSPLVIAGMKQLLDEAENLDIIGEIVDSSRLPAVIDDLRPDLIIADLEMAMNHDHAVMNLLREQNLPCKMIVFVSEVDADAIRLAADFSIDAIIMRDSSREAIIESATKVFQGKTILPDEVREAVKELSKGRRLLQELSDREVEVLKLVAEGKSNSQISNDLFITINTVRFHLANIYQKLSVSNRTEAANYYLKQDLTPDAQTRLL